jgi:hypothetical protein
MGLEILLHMTEDTSPENLRKFLESDDPAMVRMGLSMAKGNGVPEELLPTILSLYMWDIWDDNNTIRKTAKSVFMKYTPVDIQEKVKDNFRFQQLSMEEETIEVILDLLEADELDEIIAEGLINKDFGGIIYDNYWKPGYTLHGGELVTFYGDAVATAIIKIDEEWKNTLCADSCEMIEAIDWEGMPEDDDMNGYPTTYINIITEYGSEEDIRTILPLLSSDDKEVKSVAGTV